MGKTIQIAKDRSFDQTKTVLPAEVARGIYIENPPSAQALKLMHLLIAKAAGQMADDISHEMLLSDIKKIDGMRNHDRSSLRNLFIELSKTVMHYDDTANKIEIIGGFMDEIRIDYSKEDESGNLLVKWWFRKTFREMALKSNHWAIIDRQTIFALASKYSILLFQHIASLVNLEHVKSKSFSIPELRSMLGVPDNKLIRFSHFNARTIQPAIEEINQLSRFSLIVIPHKTGRNVTSLEIVWHEKQNITPIRRELDQHKVGRKARLTGTVETIIADQNIRNSKNLGNMDSFPKEGSISYSKWGVIAREEQFAPVRDIDLVANDFRYWCLSKAIPLESKNIEKTFRTFCKNQHIVK